MLYSVFDHRYYTEYSPLEYEIYFFYFLIFFTLLPAY